MNLKEMIPEPVQIKIDQAANYVDLLSPREKYLIGIAGLVLIFMIWKNILYEVVFGSEAEINQAIQRMQQSINATQTQIAMIKNNMLIEQAFSKKIKELKIQSESLKNQIQEHTKQMVTPKEMIDVIKKVLNNAKALTVIQLASTGTSELFQDKASNNIVKIYRHGIKLEVEGNYFATLEFLTSLEKENLKMIWKDIHYEVQNYPRAKVTLMLQTLGLEPGWIGV